MRCQLTIQLLFDDEIRSHVLKILSGECVFIRRPNVPKIYILSPWISDVQIEFSDLYISKEYEKLVKTQGPGGTFLFLDYNIKSINLPYALLLFKLHGGCEVESPCELNIVTLPPEEMNLSPDYLPKVKTLLDFLDEIGCNMFVNSKLHSKLLLANDLAVLGSFNLSSSALYYREEIGVSINDLDNLDRLETYCRKVIQESQPYGYSSMIENGWIRDDMEGLPPEVIRERNLSRREQITRGWLLDKLIKNAYSEGYGEFLNITGGYDRQLRSYSRDLNLFYLDSLRKLISSPKGKDLVKGFFDYQGNQSTDSIMEFVNSKFARKRVPDIRMRIKSLK